MVDAVGPAFVGGFEEQVIQAQDRQYNILYCPDRNNELLQAEGKPPVYYWIPGEVRLAQRGDGGDFMFHHTHYVGVLSEETHVGVDSNAEVQGGILAFTTTARYPTSILQQAEQQILAKFRGSDDRYWGWRTRAAPMFRIAPIQSNVTAISNVSPGRNGLSPLEEAAQPGNGGGGGGNSGGNGAAPAGPPGSPRFQLGAPRLALTPFESGGRVAHGRSFQRRSTLDAWAFQAQGQGSGSVTGGQNAYAVTMGAHASEALWGGFHGTSSPMVVAQNLVLPFWSEEIYLRVHGEWERIFEHFSSHANASSLWFNADIKVELSNLITNGDIEVEISIDGTRPGADKLEEEIQRRLDLVFDKFMRQAEEMIFKPPTPEVQQARARGSGGILGRMFGGGGVALNFTRERRGLTLNYEETRHHRYLQPTTISTQMSGIFEEMKRDPDAERKYFTRLVLGEMGRKVHRIVKPVVRWRKPETEYIGDPVAFVSAQVGYPTNDGDLVWRPSVFQRTDSDEASSDTADFVRLKQEEVRNPPAGWSPDQTFVKRTIHFEEAMGATDDPYVKVFVERNTIELDEGPNGGLTNDNMIEVRADSAGKLELEINGIDVMLEEQRQIVEIEIKPEGQTHDGNERGAVSFIFKHDDQERPRILEIFTGQPEYTPSYQYRCHVMIKGTLMSRGMSWTGPWQRGNANGSIMVHVPLMDEEGVTNVQRFSPREVADRFAAADAGVSGPKPAMDQPVPPPMQRPVVTPPPSAVRAKSTNGAVAAATTARGYTIAPPEGY